jgi:glycosyltransferase involved in cell wall biosynthesis
MLKIVHVITGLQLGGAEGVLVRLVCATQAKYEHVVVTLRDQGHFGSVLRKAGITVHEIDIGGRCNTLVGLIRLIRLIRREQPTIVQTWLYHADLLGGLAARVAGVPTVIWGVRNTNLGAAAISRSTRFVAWISARLSNLVPDVIVCNSATSSRVHVEFGYVASRFRLIANGYDIERFRPDERLRQAIRVELGIGPGDLVAGCIARWDRQKDHGNLLRALQVVVPRWPGLRIVLAGTGMDHSNQQLTELIRRARLESCITLLGPRDDIPALMNALDLHVLSSLGEAFPNVVAEAMACGTPCVVTDVGDAAYIAGDTGWVVPACDSEALAVAIDAALKALKSGSREALGSRCRERIVQSFSMSRMTESYTTLWRDPASQTRE